MGHEGMKSSLVSREVIADSVELTMRGHCYDALVTLAGCDKSLPGMMMAMLRLNVPSVFIYGGSILPGRFKGKDVTVVRRLRGRRPARRRHHDRRRPARILELRRLPVGRVLRRSVHGEHHGLRLRSHRAGAAEFGRRAGALRIPRPAMRTSSPARPSWTCEDQYPPARHRHATSAGERRHRRRRDRRLHQCCPAPAGDGATRSGSSSISTMSPRSSARRRTSPT